MVITLDVQNVSLSLKEHFKWQKEVKNGNKYISWMIIDYVKQLKDGILTDSWSLWPQVCVLYNVTEQYQYF